MGEIAEMMLDGTLCEGCGEWLGDDEPRGYPGYCSAECARGRGVFECEEVPRQGRVKPFKCDACGKRFPKEQGLKDHARDKHGVK